MDNNSDRELDSVQKDITIKDGSEIKKPLVPSLKTKIQQATVGGRLISEATAISANEGFGFSHAKTHVTAGSSGLNLKVLHSNVAPDRGNRISCTYLSQMTPSYAPMTGDEPWRGDILGQDGIGVTQQVLPILLTKED